MATVDPQLNPLGELLPALSRHEAAVEANRCLYCYDAPCINACPTRIDIPKFIKQIASGNLAGSANTIFEENLLGATCARVCPVQELCEGACVLGGDHKPIAIGRLQRFAMDRAASLDQLPQFASTRTGKRVAVVGSGPAGLSCAGELARMGHTVTIFEKEAQAGGLSTFGIVGLREPLDVALSEVELIKRLGVEVHTGATISDLGELSKEFEAIFLAIGLGGTPLVGIQNENLILDGLAYIQASKLNPASLQIGRKVIIIGAGNTAIDCASIAKRLGAEQVTILYRRSESEMPAYAHEVAFARSEGIDFQFQIVPRRVLAEGKTVRALDCVRVEPDLGPIPESEFILEADQIVRATGQTAAGAFGLTRNGRFIQVNELLETSQPGIYAGGDCIRIHGPASTVAAVQDGKRAAKAIHERVTTNCAENRSMACRI